jgi:hypothetical protein
MVMVTDLKQLLDLCNAELVDRGYGGGRQQEFVQGWKHLSHWMKEQGLLEFSEEIGFKYYDETFGGHLLRDDMSQPCRIGLRAVRMLISCQKTGDFEFRSPKVEHRFLGENGKPFTIYLLYAQNVLELAAATLSKMIPKDFSPHKMRHTTAMELVESGVDLIYIRDLLGHVGVSTTELYARADAQKKRQAIEAAGKEITPPESAEWESDSNLKDWLKKFNRR